MEISALNNLTGTTSMSPLWGTEWNNNGIKGIVNSEEENGSSFLDIFTSAIDNVRETDQVKNEMEYLLAVGELDNPAELTIASTKAQIALELLVELRTKALAAYDDLKNIQI